MHLKGSVVIGYLVLSPRPQLCTCNLAGSPGPWDWSIGGVWSARCWRPGLGTSAPSSSPPWSPGGQMARFSGAAPLIFCGWPSSLQDIIQKSNNWALSRNSKYVFFLETTMQWCLLRFFLLSRVLTLPRRRFHSRYCLSSVAWSHVAGSACRRWELPISVIRLDVTPPTLGRFQTLRTKRVKRQAWAN